MIDYVPLLNGKEGEFAALEVLAPDVRERVMPLIEVPGIPYDYANERPAKSIDAHVASVGDRLRRCWPDSPLYLDLPWFGDGEMLADGRVALAGVLADCSEAQVAVIPVVSRASSAAYLSAAERHGVVSELGLCVRLTVEDFEEEVDTDAEVTRILEGVSRIPMGAIDLVLDLEDLGVDTGRAALIARSVLGMVPRATAWRQVVLAAASFPEDLSEVDAATVSTLPRREWELWSMLQRRPKLLPRQDLVFGDYGIAHPVPRELDPRTMRMSASIRYTTPDSWLVIKGRNVRQYGFDQYFDLCRALVNRPEYNGADFSLGGCLYCEVRGTRVRPRECDHVEKGGHEPPRHIGGASDRQPSGRFLRHCRTTPRSSFNGTLSANRRQSAARGLLRIPSASPLSANASRASFLQSS